MNEFILLGVDGGGSKTDALAADTTGRVLGWGQAGGSNHQTLGLSQARDHIRQAAMQALDGQRASFAAYCLAGADLPPDFVVLEPTLHDLNLADEFRVYNDVIAVFRAGSSQRLAWPSCAERALTPEELGEMVAKSACRRWGP